MSIILFISNGYPLFEALDYHRILGTELNAKFLSHWGIPSCRSTFLENYENASSRSCFEGAMRTCACIRFKAYFRSNGKPLHALKNM
uniref:Uncharacterized protein n=1 Tax=Trichogramma kaykai TaxID=54128 RepID=A0ABD2X493_9HYME